MNQKIKILHLVSTVEQGKGIGGAEKLILFLCDALNKDKYEFIIAYHLPDFASKALQTEIEKLFQERGIEVCLFKTRNKFDVFAIFDLVRLIKCKQPNLIHSHQPRLDFLGSIAALISRVPLVVTRHLSIYRSPGGKIRKVFYQTFDRLITAAISRRIIAVSKEIAEDLIRIEKVSRGKVLVVYNGIDVHVFAGRKEPEYRIREEFKLGDCPLVGIIARINKQKAHELFLKSLTEVKRLVPQARYLIVGDGPLANDVKQLSKSLGLEKEVVFTGYREDISRIISELDVVVLSSLSEGLPVVILEAMALSKPVVSFNVGGVPEIVEHEKTGILVPFSDTDALAKAMVCILKDPQLGSKMGNLGRKRVEEKFSLKAMLEDYLGVYQKVIDGDGKK